jgi:hypothetical protein
VFSSSLDDSASRAVQELAELPSCVWTLIEYIKGSKKPLCPSPSYAPLFYHLGYVHGDSVLLRHGAQHIFVQLIATLKLAGNSFDIEIHCE